ncbi:MAG: hypothetical protein IH858_08930 [Chloroflexi bacterium]|nr:hypothetical protein [Chloroflexota bacterium]
MKKLILILSLGLVLAACAGETRVVVITATPVPPTVTPSPPTATPIPPTITPEPWDAQVNALSNGLRELPHLNSQVIERLLGGAKVDLLAVTEDHEWVQAIYTLEDGSTITGWLQVDKLRMNVSLDDLDVDTKTVFAPPPTRTPGPTGTPRPTELPLGERYVAHFVDEGFEYVPEQDRYMKSEGRLVLVIMTVDDQRQMVGYIIPTPLTSEEIDIVRDHLREAGEFLDPDFGWRTIGLALDSMSGGSQDGTVWIGGRSVVYITSAYGSLELGTAGTVASYTFLAEGQLLYEGD